MKLLSLVYFIFLLSSCSATKGLKKHEFLYVDGKVKINDPENIKGLKNLENQLEIYLPRETKPGLLNIYLGLHNLYDSTATSGFRNWVKNKLGNPPVIFEDKFLTNSEAKIDFHLRGKGYFRSKVKCDSTSNNQKLKITCQVDLGQRYVIDSIIYPNDSTARAIQLTRLNIFSPLKKGKFYDRDLLSKERNRIINIANDRGFADFSNENIIYYVDTLKKNHGVDIYMEILQPTDSTYHIQYILDKINIFPNYSLINTNDPKLTVTKIRDSLNVYETEPFLDHNLINSIVRLELGTLHNATNQGITINRFLDLGLFKFVNVQNKISTKSKYGFIEQNFYLTPLKMQSVTGELELNNRSGNFFGTGASISYNHRNLFGGAEKFRLALSGQVESQFGDELSFINSSDINISAELSFPRIILPFFKIKQQENFVPRTIISSAITFQRRVQFYSTQSAVAKYGFRFRTSNRSSHELYPVVINQIGTSNKTALFEELLNSDARLFRSFEDVFIIGSQYVFNFTNQTNGLDKSYRFFRVELESSGMLLSLVSSREQEFFNTPYAQYLKATLDYRRYFRAKSIDFATRIIIGSGVSIGNDTELPYIKQYYIGGSNSLRGFNLRGLGPGSFVRDPSTIDKNLEQFIDQTGDLKLEINIEARFSLFNYLKGAIFLEGGNIWLIDDKDSPSGNFKFNSFYKQLALSTGIGFRFDFNFFVFRLDLGFPLRAPIYEEGFQWKIRDIDPFNSTWRSENLRYNIGIGYPF